MTRWFWTSAILAAGLVGVTIIQQRQKNSFETKVARLNFLLDRAGNCLGNSSGEALRYLGYNNPYPLKANSAFQQLLLSALIRLEEIEEYFQGVSLLSNATSKQKSEAISFLSKQFDGLRREISMILYEHQDALGLEDEHLERYLAEYLHLFTDFPLFNRDDSKASTLDYSMAQIQYESQILGYSLFQKINDLRGFLLNCFPTYYAVAEPISEHAHPDSVNVRIAIVELSSAVQYEGYDVCWKGKPLPIGSSGLHQVVMTKGQLTSFSGEDISIDGVNQLTGETWTFRSLQREPLLLWPSAIF